MSHLDVQTLNALTALGVGFRVPITHPGGQQEYFASAEEILVLERNFEEFDAMAHRLTLDQYREWKESGCSLICSANTKAGNRCSNFVRGGFQISAEEWMKRYGERCPSHGG